MKNIIELGGDFFNLDTIRRINPFYIRREIVKDGKLKGIEEYYPSCLIHYIDDDSRGYNVVLEKEKYPDSEKAKEKAYSILSKNLS